MKVRLYPTTLCGSVTPPPSKSLLHRELIAQALAGVNEPCSGDATDVAATARALRQLQEEERPLIDCGDSGATLRFLLPLAMARGQVGTVFTGTERLLARPIPDLSGWERCAGGIRVTQCLQSGSYAISGSETSQIVSGLLMALPLCEGASRISLLAPLVSRPYVDMTLAVLRRHGITITETPAYWDIPGGQRYRPAYVQQEADWSAAAWFYVLNELGCAIQVQGLRHDSLQGDRCIAALCRALPETVDVSATPDLLPPLALLAALQPGRVTRFVGAAFLRGKESDRLQSTAQVLRALGGCVQEEEDGLRITGVPQLVGGQVDSWHDHRIAMLCACAAVRCRVPVELCGAACVKKSYPRFWEDYVNLGGKMEVIAP